MEYDLADIRAFIQVVDHGGVSIAATQMSVAKSVLSSRIARLERQLNTKLLHRSPRGVTLTDAGQRFYDRMRDVISRLQEAVDEVADGVEADLQAKLRITAQLNFGIMHIGTKLY